MLRALRKPTRWNERWSGQPQDEVDRSKKGRRTRVYFTVTVSYFFAHVAACFESAGA